MGLVKTFVREGHEETQSKTIACVCLCLRSNRYKSTYPRPVLLRAPLRIAFDLSR